MSLLTASLAAYLADQLQERLERAGGRLQIVFVGPPLAVLPDLLAETREAMIGRGLDVQADIIGAPSDVLAGLGRFPSWDHAVSMRNSFRHNLLIVTPTAWDLRPESIANASETLGVPRVGDAVRHRAAPWPYLIQQIAASHKLDEEIVWTILRQIAADASALDQPHATTHIWVTADLLLDPGGDPFAIAGIPRPDTRSLPGVQVAYKTLQDLAELARKLGFVGLEKTLASQLPEVETDEVPPAALTSHLTAMLAHIRQSSRTAAAFALAPMAHFAIAGDVPQWWTDLTATRLARILAESGFASPLGGVQLRVANPLIPPPLRQDEPPAVKDRVRLEAIRPDGLPLEAGVLWRRVGRRRVEQIGVVVGGEAMDDAPPAHSEPLTYIVRADGYRDGEVRVLSLATFGCHGIARIVDAERNPPPEQRIDGSWSQEISISASGAHMVRIATNFTDAMVELEYRGETREIPATIGDMDSLALDDGDHLPLRLIRDGVVLGAWTIDVTIADPDQTESPSRFEALVSAHRHDRERPSPVSVPANGLASIERVLSSTTLPRGAIVAAWSPSADLSLFEASDGRLGDVAIRSDARPTAIEAPPDVVSLRSEVVSAIAAQRDGLVAGADLADRRLLELVRDYAAAYRVWLASSPEQAVWWDLVAMHASILNTQAGQITASGEPTAVLITPIHPLRLAWHANAQRLLSESIADTRCPGAALLNPQATPASLALPLFDGSRIVAWRAFFGAGADQPHWSVLWNHKAARDERGQVADVLDSLGLSTAQYTPGFTASQTSRVLQDLEAMLSARSILEVGLVGGSDRARGGIQQLIAWAQVTFDSAEGKAWPSSLEVNDYRTEHSYPSASGLAVLTERTGGKVRWFHQPHGQPARGLDDLVIVDDLAAVEITTTAGEGRSVLAPGALYRRDIRSETGANLWLTESRVARGDSPDTADLAVLPFVLGLALEQLTERDAQVSQLRFRPNLEALEARLTRSTFVAATSSQLDPACFTRGAGAAGGYLWDYELPALLDPPDQAAGYYLIARPTEAIRAAVAEAVALVGVPEVDVTAVLDEISQRGLPVLKRISLGGGQARGELGLLLAMRLLQGTPDGKNARIPAWDGSHFALLVPLDSYERPLRQFRERLLPGMSGERADLLLIEGSAEDPVGLHVTPIEVKFRAEGAMSAAEQRDALAQATASARLLERLWVSSANELWRTAGRATLSQILDQAFRVNSLVRSPESWPKLHETVVRSVVTGQAPISVDPVGRVLIFCPVEHSRAADVNEDGSADTLVVSVPDAARLLREGALSEEGQLAFDAIRLGAGAMQTSGVAGEEPRPDQRPDVGGPHASDEPRSARLGEGSSTTGAGRAPDAEVSLSGARERVRQGFSGFVGNTGAVRRVTNDLLQALLQEPPELRKNYLLTGPPSTGKTELARRMARILGLPFVRLDGRALTSRDRLIDLMRQQLSDEGVQPSTGGFPPMVVLIDEAHLATSSTQEALLTGLDRDDSSILVGTTRIDVASVTFILATTRASEIDAALRTRCSEVQLQEYTASEVAEIVRGKVERDWPDEIYGRISTLGRHVPRIAIDIAKELETQLAVTDVHQDLTAHLDDVRRARSLDPIGISPADLDYLRILMEGNRPLGEQAIANQMRGTDRARITEEIEPHLIRLGFVQLGDRGRELTARGRRYLLEARLRN